MDAPDRQRMVEEHARIPDYGRSTGEVLVDRLLTRNALLAVTALSAVVAALLYPVASPPWALTTFIVFVVLVFCGVAVGVWLHVRETEPGIGRTRRP
ncbi:MAG: hypothetical protein ABEJ70_01005 [Halobacteriaceae archaeon]